MKLKLFKLLNFRLIKEDMKLLSGISNLT